MHASALTRENADLRAFLDALDALDQRLAFTNCVGQVIFATGVMQRLLREHASLVANVGSFARDLCDQARESERATAIRERVWVREIIDKGGAWVATASHITFDMFGGGPSVLVTLEKLPVDVLAPAILRERFGLSRQECRVARLLALGRSNAAIALELSISPHTVRHHTQRIIDKVGTNSRAALVSTLLRPDG